MSIEERNVRPIIADPSALGLFGLGMVTLVASSQKLGMTSGLSLIIPWAVFLGCFAQMIACIIDFQKNNIFGATVFGAFSLFWIVVAMSWLTIMGVFGEAMSVAADPVQLGFGFLGFLIFALFMTIGSVETTKNLFTIFLFVDVLLVALTLGAFGIAVETMGFIAGISELAVALLSLYGSCAIVLNVHFGRIVLPLGKPFGIFKK